MKRILLALVFLTGLHAQTLINGNRVQIGHYNYCLPAGGTDTYACNLAACPSNFAYVTGAQYHFKADVANTGAATINYCAEGAATIKKLRDQDLATGDIEAGQVVTLQYDGTNMQMQSQLASAAAGASPLTTKGDLYGFTTVDARLAVGTNGFCLKADSAEAIGVKWVACGSGGGLTHRISLLNSSVQPDSTGNAFSELYTVKATNDFWKHAVWTFNDTASKDCIYGSSLVPNDYSGSAVAYVFWTSTATSGNAIWDWEYRGIGGDDAESLDQATAAESLTVTDAAPTATDRRMTSSMAITSANLAASDTLQWRLCRDGASADTIAAALTVHDVVLEYVTP